jgi:hypothetical protein
VHLADEIQLKRGVDAQDSRKGGAGRGHRVTMLTSPMQRARSQLVAQVVDGPQGNSMPIGVSS